MDDTQHREQLRDDARAIARSEQDREDEREPNVAAGSVDAGRGQAPTEPPAPPWGQLTRTRDSQDWRSES